MAAEGVTHVPGLSCYPRSRLHLNTDPRSIACAALNRVSWQYDSGREIQPVRRQAHRLLPEHRGRDFGERYLSTTTRRAELWPFCARRSQ